MATARTTRASSAHSTRRVVVLVAFALVLLVSPWLSIVWGAASVAPGDVVGVVLNHLPGVHVPVTWDRVTEAIVWDNRMPRVLSGLGAGVVLGVTGVAFQAIVRNPLAEPYVLGVSSGAAVGAASAVIVVGAVSSLVITGMAFIGATLATAIVLLIGGRRGGSPLRLVLAGLAVSFICQAVTNLVIFSAPTAETAQAVVFWTLGSLARPSWHDVALLLVVAVVMTILLALISPVLDALASGDTTSIAIGINPGLARILVLIPVSAAVAVVVAQCGGIGFIGLVVPHVVRPLVGHAHRWLVVATALLSGSFLVTADAVTRTVFSPRELPIGVVTGLVGAPFLLVLLGRRSGWSHD